MLNKTRGGVFLILLGDHYQYSVGYNNIAHRYYRYLSVDRVDVSEMSAAPVIDLCEVSKRAPPATGLHRLTRTKPGTVLVSLSFFLVGVFGSLLIPPLGLLAAYVGVVSHRVMRRGFDVCIACWYVFATVSSFVVAVTIVRITSLPSQHTHALCDLYSSLLVSYISIVADL